MTCATPTSAGGSHAAAARVRRCPPRPRAYAPRKLHEVMIDSLKLRQLGLDHGGLHRLVDHSAVFYVYGPATLAPVDQEVRRPLPRTVPYPRRGRRRQAAPRPVAAASASWRVR